jgi:hypothetical protein
MFPRLWNFTGILGKTYLFCDKEIKHNKNTNYYVIIIPMKLFSHSVKIVVYKRPEK